MFVYRYNWRKVQALNNAGLRQVTKINIDYDSVNTTGTGNIFSDLSKNGVVIFVDTGKSEEKLNILKACP
jgi:hypothetical protein